MVENSLKDEQGKPPKDRMEQKFIDPTTGRDITGQYISEKLNELEKTADAIIRVAMKQLKKTPKNKKEIYKKAYNEIHQKLGMGSIGPATAAVGPLMSQKKSNSLKRLELQKRMQLHKCLKKQKK